MRYTEIVLGGPWVSGGERGLTQERKSWGAGKNSAANRHRYKSEVNLLDDSFGITQKPSGCTGTAGLCAIALYPLMDNSSVSTGSGVPTIDPNQRQAAHASEKTPLFSRLRWALFDGFIAVAHGAPLSRPLFLLLHLVGLLQLLLFPLSPSLQWRVSSNPVTAFQGFLLAVALSPWTDAAGSVASYSRLSMYVFACVYTGLMIGLFIQFASGNLDHKQGRLRMQLLRALLHVALTAGIVPLTANLLSPLVCDPVTSLWGGLTCWGSVHAAAVSIGVLFFSATLLLLLFATLMMKSPVLDLKGACAPRSAAPRLI